MQTLLLYGIRGGVFLVLLMPLLVTTETLFPYIVGKALYSRAMIEIVFGLWVALAYRYPSHRPPSSWLLVAFGAYLAVAVISALLGVSTVRSLWSTYERMQGVIDLAHWFALTVVLVSVFRSIPHWRVALNINLAVSLVVALLGLAQHRGIAIPVFPFLEATDRLEITLGNANYVGAYMMVNVMIGLGFLAQSYQSRVEPQVSRAPARRRRRRRRQRDARDWHLFWWRLFWITVIVLDFWVFWLSGTRGAFIGLSTGMVIFAAAYLIWGRNTTIKRTVYSALGILLTLAIVIFLAKDSAVVLRIADSNVMLRRIVTAEGYTASVTGRRTSLSAGLQGFGARPALGWGPENYMIAWGRYFDAASGVTQRFDQAHNKLVEELTTKGLFGLLSYLAIWVLMLRAVHRRVSRGDPHDQLLTLGVGAALTGYFVQNLFLFDTPATALQFVFMLGFVVSLETTSESGESVPVAARSLESREESTDASQPSTAAGYRWPGSLRGLWARSTIAGVVTRLANVDISGRSQGQRYLPVAALAIGFFGIYASLIIFLIVNFRTYDAARAVVLASSPSIARDQSLGHYERSINSFPPLANYPRLIFFNQLTRNLDKLTVGQAREALAMAEREARRAIEAEPRGWRIYTALGYLYQRASLADARYIDTTTFLDRARSFVDKAAELAPDTLEVASLLKRQQATEDIHKNKQEEPVSE